MTLRKIRQSRVAVPADRTVHGPTRGDVHYARESQRQHLRLSACRVWVPRQLPFDGLQLSLPSGNAGLACKAAAVEVRQGPRSDVETLSTMESAWLSATRPLS